MGSFLVFLGGMNLALLFAVHDPTANVINALAGALCTIRGLILSKVIKW